MGIFYLDFKRVCGHYSVRRCDGKIVWNGRRVAGISGVGVYYRCGDVGSADSYREKTKKRIKNNEARGKENGNQKMDV